MTAVSPFDDQGDDAFHRRLGLLDMTLIGVGGTIGVGIFVLTGVAAARYAGPGVSIAFLVAAFACACAALCYAELASMIPSAGSAYVYARATLGTAVAAIVGWNLILEYLFAGATVAVGWSSYFQSMIGLAGLMIPSFLAEAPISCHGFDCRTASHLINLPAMAVVMICAFMLASGTALSVRVNAVITAVKLTVILLVIGLGFQHIDPANLTPIVPANTGSYGEFGWSGVVRAAGLVFFAYIGFDQVSTCAQEARNPRRDVPLAILLGLAICTVLYVGMAIVMTGLAPYATLDVANPVYVAIDAAGPRLAWLKPVVAIGATIGLTSAVLVTLYGQVRIFYAMSRDGLMPRMFSRIDPARRTPVAGTMLVGCAAAILAGLLPIDLLGELVSMGTLLVFAVICLGVMVLRMTDPDRRRGFRTPAIWFVAPTGIAVCLYMMASLPPATWVRLALWTLAGGAFFLWYVRRRGPRTLGAVQ